MSSEEEKLQKPNFIALRCPEVDHSDKKWPSSHDLLGRDKEIENLSPVLLNVQAPLVFAIDAPWGAGKTNFIKLLQQYLEHSEQVSLYLNAWENDFSDDPLLPLMSVIDDWLSPKSEKTVTNEAWEKAKKYTPGIIKATAVATAKAATFGVLDLDKEYEKLASDLAGGAIESLVDEFNIQKEVLIQFKILITEAIKTLPEGQQNLIIFIDELDRCKPTFAIEMLERIKHLFDIERLVFVLALNRDQLSKSLQGVYGPSFDGGHYLKRFIDLDYRLHVSDKKSYIYSRLGHEDIQSYFNSRDDGINEFDSLKNTLNYLLNRFSYELRDIDQVITRLRLIIKSIPAKHYFDPEILSVLLILRDKKPELYEKYIDNLGYVNEVIEFVLGKISEQPKVFDGYGVVAGLLIRAGLRTHEKSEINTLVDYWKEQIKDLDDKSDDYDQLNTLIGVAENTFGPSSRHDMRKSIFERLELISQIDLGE
jgi:hypothetical protein